MLTNRRKKYVWYFISENGGKEKRMSTKERILIESMKLFSINGFDAVSVRMIADAVGVGNSALYKHYKSKQAILDAIVEKSKERFCSQYQNRMQQMQGIDDLKEMCLSMYRFQTEDEWMLMFRRILVIEQFKNPQMASLYQQFFIELPVQSQANVFRELIQEGMMKDRDAEVMAMELYAPFFLYHMATKESLTKQLEQHVENFIEMYFVKKEG